jgi:hypothetical protein
MRFCWLPLPVATPTLLRSTECFLFLSADAVIVRLALLVFRFLGFHGLFSWYILRSAGQHHYSAVGMVVCDRDFWQFIKIILCVYILIDGSEIFNNIAPGTSFVSRHRDFG